MKETSKVRKIALVGDHLPRKCGIATFSSDRSRPSHRSADQVGNASVYLRRDNALTIRQDVIERNFFAELLRTVLTDEVLDSYRSGAY